MIRPERFEFMDARRGPMVQLQWQKFTITCTEWPGTLLALLRDDMLGPKAKAEAVALGGHAA